MKQATRNILTLVIVATLIVLLVGCEPQQVVTQDKAVAEQATWTMILALIAPLIIAVFKQSGLTKEQNSLIALGLCLAVGIGDAFYFGQVDPADVAQTIFNIITGAFAAYKMIWQPFGFDQWWTDATSVIKKPY